MFSRPMFRREYRAATRARRPFVLRTFVAAALVVVALLVGLIAHTANPGAYAAGAFVTLGRAVFVATVSVQVLMLVFFVPAFVGGAVAEERERDTLSSLLLTRLTPLEIVATKAAARWLAVVNLMLAGLPVLVVAAWAGGLEREFLLALPALASTSAFMATLAVLASCAREQAAAARGQAMAWAFGWLIGPPFLTIIPVSTATLWGMLLAELKAVCVLIAPSSPLALVTDPGWYTRTPAAGLGERIAWMIALQAAFGLLALGFAAGRLKARERNPNWADPTRGFRPPCGDDPIYWREYELPTRRGGGSLIALRLRSVVILVKALLLNVLTLTAILLLLAIPLGLVVGTVYYGSEAFREVWQYGYGPGGPFDARARFNLLVRAATGLLAFFPLLSLVSFVSGRIISERDKSSWETLLTTPLDGGEILRSKARAALHALRGNFLPLPAVWALGLACGVVGPVGVLWAAADLVLAAWLFLALGFTLSLRPGLTAVASSRVATWSLVLFVAHAPLLWALLSTPRELAVFAAWDPRLRAAVVLACLAVTALTGTAAWLLTRTTLARFDEWVGRPCRRATARPGGVS